MIGQVDIQVLEPIDKTNIGFVKSNWMNSLEMEE